MDPRRRAWLPWAAAGLLAALCGVLAILQYRWIGEISNAARQNLEAGLHDRLDDLASEFNRQLSEAERTLQPSGDAVERLGVDAAYAAQYQRWQQTHEPLFARIALARPRGDGFDFSILDPKTGQFAAGPWPVEWNGVEHRLDRQLRDEPAGPQETLRQPVLEVPQFRGGPGPAAGPSWLLLELDTAYVDRQVLPELIARHLSSDGKLDYDAEVVSVRDPSIAIYRSSADAGARIGNAPDAVAPLLEQRAPNPRILRGGNGGRPPAGPPLERPQGPRERFARRSNEDFGRGPFPGGPGPGGPALWQLRVRHKSGSLEALVAQARRRDLAVSAGILLLILGTVGMLVHLSRREQQLAALQMNFVAGVSHELRTPLTVIRTAAYNLRGKIAYRAEQVEQYGALILSESEKLGALVEQILLFASAKAGHAIRQRVPVAMEPLIDDSIAAAQASAGQPGIVLEKHVEPGLPRIYADESALKHALQNLVINAVKYGTAGSPWVGIAAAKVEGENGPAVEISVRDRGPGIPPDEQKHVFDPFFRGRRALADQVHGTGLGLDLVKRIVEAHGGTVRVESAPETGTAFIVRLPAISAERQDELAHSLG